MDLNRVSSGPLWADKSRISEKAFGKFARSQGISDWDAAGLVSDMTGMGLEAAHHKLNAVDLDQLRPSSGKGLPLPMFRRGASSESATIPLGGLVSRFPPGQDREQSQDDRGPVLLRDVLENGTSGDSDRRRLRRDALQRLGDLGCTRELVRVVERFVTSGDSDARETRRTALRMLGPAAAEDLCRLVMNHATSGDCDARETRRAALSKMGDFGCTRELVRVVERLVTSGDSDARETRRSAMEMLGSDSASELANLVLRYATSGDCDARETRRSALRKLGAFGCLDELVHIADRLSTSGDSDAREVRRMALEML
jgi:ribosomal protein L17